jgi:HSP20 family molecular chaperone IbpA
MFHTKFFQEDVMKMTPWMSRVTHPSRLLDRWDGNMDSFITSFFGPGLDWLGVGYWMPRLDMNESKDELIVKADLPGMK